MAEHKTIPRRQPDPDGLDFDGLKAVGIEQLQILCGATWTDYNLHDPGITVLEQLCYALTELHYQARFDVADYLAGAEGAIDFDRQALYRPRDILPSQAVTLADYRKLIIDAVPEIDQVWLSTEAPSEAGAAGCYSIYVRLRDVSRGGVPISAEAVLQQVRAIYAANRNLGEDLERVSIVAERPYRLQGRIELSGERAPDAVLAQIYFDCARLVAGDLSTLSHTEKHAQGATLEQLFSGPPSERACVEDSSLEDVADTVSIVDLFGCVGRIEGVSYVDQLALRNVEGATAEMLRFNDYLAAIPCLAYPDSEQAIGVQLYKNGRQHPVSLTALRAELDRLHGENRVDRRSADEIDRICALPTGVPGRFGPYHSIQHDFPAIYGIGAYGLPKSTSRKRQAQAKQFKAYLLFFEQILANAQENLRQAGRLFSLDPELEASSFCRALDADSVPDIEALYAAPAELRQQQLAEVLASYDDFGDRRNRVLDYLLALHGESFSQRSLRHFEHYLADGDVEAELIRNKLRLLASIVELSRKRAGAFNYLAAPADAGNCAKLVSKVGILLGMRHSEGGSPTAVLRDLGLQLVADADLQWRGADAMNESLANAADAPMQAVDFLRRGTLSLSILQRGIDLDAYRVVPSDGAFDIQFMPADDGVWRSIASHATRGAAVELIRALRDLLIRINVDSERMQLVEHILLRPRAGSSSELSTERPLADDFYAFRLSVVFPAWSARCRDAKFRNLAEETVRLNCPAHLYPEFLWLDYAAMVEFETHQAAWIDALRGEDPNRIDTASTALIALLVRLRAEEKADA